MLEQLLSEYEGRRAVTCPSDLGLPVLRRRLYMWFDLKETLDEIHVDMAGLFAASCRSVRMSPRTTLACAHVRRPCAASGSAERRDVREK